jgi:hypothetical protein
MLFSREKMIKLDQEKNAAFCRDVNVYTVISIMEIHGVRDKLYFVIWQKSDFFIGNGTLSFIKNLRGVWVVCDST